MMLNTAEMNGVVQMEILLGHAQKEFMFVLYVIMEKLILHVDHNFLLKAV